MRLKVASCLLQGVELVVHELREVRADRLARAPAQSVIAKLALTPPLIAAKMVAGR